MLHNQMLANQPYSATISYDSQPRTKMYSPFATTMPTHHERVLFQLHILIKVSILLPAHQSRSESDGSWRRGRESDNKHLIRVTYKVLPPKCSVPYLITYCHYALTNIQIPSILFWLLSLTVEGQFQISQRCVMTLILRYG
ncbi:hypothetical protein D1872_260440 [compost metagenome]